MPKAKKSKPVVAIIMGSDSDFPVMKDAAAALKEMGVAYEMKVISAHRTPGEMAEFAKKAHGRGIRVIVAGAGGAAHLPGMVAAFSELPVIGVPVPHGALQGEDALLSIVQMPRGVPVATVAIGNSYNAGLLAAQIIGFGGSLGDTNVARKLQTHKQNQRAKVLRKKLPTRI